MCAQTEMMGYCPVQEIWRGDVNDIMICKDNNPDSDRHYTMLYVKERKFAKRLLAIKGFHETYESCFSWRDRLCVVFAGAPADKLNTLLEGNLISVSEYRDICTQIVAACMGSKLPMPILYLILLQENIHRKQDGSIDISIDIDMALLEEEKTERQCANLCVSYLIKLYTQLRKEPGKRNTDTCYELLIQKANRTGYHNFLELYQDIQATRKMEKRKKRIVSIQKALSKKDWLWKVLLFASLLLFFAACIFFFSCMTQKEGMLWLFQTGFEYIGTKSLIE